MKRLTLIILILTAISSCSNKQNEKQQNDDFIQVSEVDYKTLNHTLLDSTTGRINLLVDKEFASALYLGDNTVKGLQNINNGIFEVSELRIPDADDTLTVYKLSYKDSYIKIFYNDFEGVISDSYFDLSTNDLVSAIVKDETIVMQNGIHIGMGKDTFFSKILGNTFSNKVDTIYMSDELADNEHLFIFCNNKLEKVLTSSSYDFSDFRIN